VLQNLRGRIFPSVDAEPRPLNERFRRAQRTSGSGATPCSRNSLGILEAFLLLQDHPRTQGLRGADDAGVCGTRAEKSTRHFRATR